MNRSVKIALNLIVWIALSVYLVVSARYCSRRQANLTCTGLEIVVRDSLQIGFLTDASIRSLLTQRGLKLRGVPIRSIDLPEIERAVAAQPWTKRARVYHTLDGTVRIEVEQREPILRVQSENGYRFYLSTDGCVMPIRRTTAGIDVPIVTGLPVFPFGTDFAGKVPNSEKDEKNSDKKMLFYRNLINFVEFLRSDSFWGDQVVQIDVTRENEVILIPRVGTGIIRLGTLDDYGEKLGKLLRFYRQGLAYEGWNKYSIIDIRFRDQVVCTK